MNTEWENVKALWDAHKGKIIGTVVGLLVGLFIIRYGLWRTLFVAALVAGGLWLGSLLDREGWESLYDRVSRRDR